MGTEQETACSLEHKLADLDFKAWQLLEELAAAKHCEGFNPVRTISVDLRWARKLVDVRRELLRKLDTVAL